MNPFDKQKSIEGIRHIILVGSGKGGVGKSTIALNLAHALSKMNLSVGLLDGDIYGPSLPRLTGTLHETPQLKNNKLLPIRQFGLFLMSLGYLVKEESPAIWRGPMLFKAIEQFFNDVDWGELDFLIIDLPPGTGDVALTIAQKAKVSGAIIVTTPQNLALVDTKKAVNMMDHLKVPLIGVVENMTELEIEAQKTKLSLFPKGQLDVYLQEKKIRKLGQIPFHPSVGLCSEAGVPLLESLPTSVEARVFTSIASVISEKFKKAT